MTRSEAVFSEVSKLYLAESAKAMGKWMWRNHVQWVADKAKALAEKYGADPEQAYCAALLHDLADCQYDRGHESFDAWSEAKGIDILIKAGFAKAEANNIVQTIIRSHSCRPGNMPRTLEGKILATADAMFHLQTNIYPVLCYMHRPEHTKTYEEWQAWFSGHIEKDFGPKIFFDDEREEVREDYEALSKVFKNTTLDSKAG